MFPVKVVVSVSVFGANRHNGLHVLVHRLRVWLRGLLSRLFEGATERPVRSLAMCARLLRFSSVYNSLTLSS
jgi:hypothetical protein